MHSMYLLDTKKEIHEGALCENWGATFPEHHDSSLSSLSGE